MKVKMNVSSSSCYICLSLTQNKLEGAECRKKGVVGIVHSTHVVGDQQLFDVS